MTAWEDRPQVAAIMLNPALCSVLLSESARAYAGQANAPAMPFPLAFVVLPLVLHRPSRQALPRDTRTYLTAWLGRHPVVRAGFPGRAQALVGHTREALRFGERSGVLSMTGAGVQGQVDATKVNDAFTRELAKASRLAGRWFALAGPVPTVFQALGVRS